MYFLRGGLPWQGLQANTVKRKYEKIGEKKQATSSKELCEGFPRKCVSLSIDLREVHLGFTGEFMMYMEYVRNLGFEETPDYGLMRELFTNVILNSGEVDDGVYDWMRGRGQEQNLVGFFQIHTSLLSSILICLFSEHLFPNLRRTFRLIVTENVGIAHHSSSSNKSYQARTPVSPLPPKHFGTPLANVEPQAPSLQMAGLLVQVIILQTPQRLF